MDNVNNVNNVNNVKKNYGVRVIFIGLIMMFCCGLTFMVLAAQNNYTFTGYIMEVFVGSTLPTSVRNIAMLQLLPTIGGFLLVIGGTKILAKNAAASENQE